MKRGKQTTKTAPCCWWCHKRIQQIAGTRMWWSGWDLTVKDLWPYSGVVVCGPLCKQRPSHPTDPAAQAPIREMAQLVVTRPGSKRQPKPAA